MSLQRLPPETLSQIFDEIGTSFFREDFSRLTICKQWSKFALPTYFKYITLSQGALRNLIASGLTERSSSLKDSLEILEFELKGYASNEDETKIPLRTWREILNSDLVQLATTAQQSRKLRTLRIRAQNYPYAEIFPGPKNYISLSVMQQFLSLENLTFLKLDLSTGFLHPSGEQVEGCHICRSIAALLPTLRTLHIRMQSICPNALKPKGRGDSLHLGVLVVNLSLLRHLPGITSAAHSKRCDALAGGLLPLKADMKKQAERIATRMASPKIIRIITHTLPQFEIQSLDVLTGKTMVLDEDMEWDEDGETVKEVPETESESVE
ncbi:hypothetical protein F5Y04DRAFT_291833 [Hypomontagnella monticulosa]|nr:hypothetical protein F5Y04DRAFT_291833 [Hypomontagnella monticulosa]